MGFIIGIMFIAGFIVVISVIRRVSAFNEF
jgi:hypothetical protein